MEVIATGVLAGREELVKVSANRFLRWVWTMMLLSSTAGAVTAPSDEQIRELVRQSLQQHVPARVVGKFMYGFGSDCSGVEVDKVELRKVGDKSLRPILVKVRLGGSCELRGAGRITVELRGAAGPRTFGAVSRQVSFRSDLEHEYSIEKNGYGDWIAKYRKTLNRRRQ